MQYRKNIFKKILIISAILLLSITINTFVKAAADEFPEEYDVFGGDPGTNTESNRGPGYVVHQIDGHWTFCIQHKSAYNATLTEEILDSYYNEDDGVYATAEWCDNELDKPWEDDDAKTTMHYTRIGIINEIEHQDSAYVLAAMIPNFNENNYNYKQSSLRAIWCTSVNLGSREGVIDALLEGEAMAYQDFYDEIHDKDNNNTDIFKDLVQDTTTYSDVKVAVNQNDGSYTVGPFNISYPDGYYDGKNKFSWIENIYAETDAGKVNVTLLSSTGSVITGIGQGGNTSLNGRDFYIKFNNTSATNLRLKVEYGYLESCSAEMYKYKGVQRLWKWSAEKVRDSCGHGHGSEDPYYDANGTYHPGDDGTNYPVYRYELDYEDGEDTQYVMHVGVVSKNYKYGEFDTTTGVDLTMMISGNVFLDKAKDLEKDNEGNNKLDDGEQLAGVEVRLFDSGNNQIGITLTDEKGYYEFKDLNPFKKYYVRFTYNGMLYTNVTYNPTGDDTSKATEEGQDHSDNRQSFNNLFAEIGSYPQNYKTKDCITGQEIYNQTYLQTDIVDLFKEVTQAIVANNGNEQAAYQTIINKYGESIRSKLQFVADCRINAYTVKQYPTINEFIIDYPWTYMAGKSYNPIYSGTYSQRNVNLGIKARPAIDMRLEKDVRKVEVSINEKTETYNYKPDTKPTPRVGINESDYISGIREAYLNDDKEFINNYQTTYDIEREDLSIYTRDEEITNGKLDNRSDSSIATYDLAEEDKLKILVTYRLKITNQASAVGAITEIVDYYDPNFKFVSAYFGDEEGTKLENKGTVISNENSKYSACEYKAQNNGYKTIYLTSKTETRLGSSEAQYIYVVFELNDPSELLTSELITNNNDQLSTMNIAEINGYKTYASKDTNDQTTLGLIDIDSNPGNVNISGIDNINNVVSYDKENSGIVLYEDDVECAQALLFKRQESRTLEGTVFEDSTGKDSSKVYTGEERTGDGLGEGETGIAGVIVELIEIKDSKMIVRATTTTNSNGWYGFTGFIPGNYTIRYTYGSNDDTAMTTSVKWIEGQSYQGLNAKSYNGQDYQSTTYVAKSGYTLSEFKVTTDETLKERYIENANHRDSQESPYVFITNTNLSKYESGYYWYTIDDKLSDAIDDADRKQQVIDYSNNEYGVEITNHKAEVFNSYLETQPEHINEEINRALANELERRTYRYAYTPLMEVEVECARKTIITTGNQKYDYKITGVDFGIVERPKSELTIDQDVARIKVTTADGNVLFDTETETSNLQWINNGDINKYDKQELINIIMDEELISGAQLEVTYNLTVTNNSEKDADTTTRAKGIIDYVANNLNFDENDNLIYEANGEQHSLWEVVAIDAIKTDEASSLINEVVDLETQSVILKATEYNPLVKTDLAPGEQVTSTLTLKKVLSTESSTDDLVYTNLTEIVEIDNTVGRYDHGAIPGNQKLEEQPQEHDTSGASQYTTFYEGNIDTEKPQDGTIIVTPPTGSNYIYYVIGITSAVILAAGLFAIKKFVIDKRK